MTDVAWHRRDRAFGYPKMTRAEGREKITITLPRSAWWSLLVVTGRGYREPVVHLGRTAVKAIEREVFRA